MNKVGLLTVSAIVLFCGQVCSAQRTQLVQWGQSITESSGLASTGLVTIARQPISNAASICAGDAHALAVLADSTVVGWGWNLAGQATGTKSDYPYVGSGPVILDGKPLRGVAAVAAGRLFSLALKEDRTVIGWGEIESGTKLRLPPDLTNIVSIAAAGNHALALRSDGSVVGIGSNGHLLSALTNVVSLAVSRVEWGRDIALLRSGTCVAWELRGTEMAVRPVRGVQDVIAIASGGGHSLFLNRSGKVVERYENEDTVHDVLKLTEVKAIAAGAERASLALRSDGTVSIWGGFHRTAQPPEGLTNVIAIAAGERFFLALQKKQAQ